MKKLIDREPDFESFVRIMERKERPRHLPFYEHIASPGFIAALTNTPFQRMTRDDPEYWKVYVDFWMSMGFDCVPMEVKLNCPLNGNGMGAFEGGVEGVIKTRGDFEKYPWPSLSDPVNYRYFENAAKLLPDGAKIVGGVAAGPYEWVIMMMGYDGLSYALADDPELVGLMFKKIGSLHLAAHRTIATLPGVGMLRQGDDLGFKTGTFLPPSLIREHVFPVYRGMVKAAHDNGLHFILHSCGDLSAIYDGLIDECGIDAKHSFEEAILPVDRFKERYGRRITAIGGLDVDVICRSSRDELKAYTRRMVERCYADGFWALGTGNSLTDYMPPENYLTVLREGLKAAA